MVMVEEIWIREAGGHEVNAYIRSQFEFVYADSDMATLIVKSIAHANLLMTIDGTAADTKLEVCP